MEMLKGLIVHITHHGACMQARFAAILIALCLLVGIVSFSSLLSGAIGINTGEPAPPSGTTSATPIDSPTPATSEAAGTAPDQAEAGTGTTPALTPTVTPTGYIEQDSTALPVTSAPPLPATSVSTSVPTSVPPTTTETSTSTQAPIAAGADPTPRVTERPERADPVSNTIQLRVLDGDFSPSSITVPAGAKVTIVFDNQDVDIPHNVVVYADKADPIFAGTIVKGPGLTTDTFTAPSVPGTYVLGCGVPSPHRKGTFKVE
jgi:plastocyanin